MTVEGEHVYHVSLLGALAHNTCANKLRSAMNKAGVFGDEGAIPHHMVSRFDLRALDARKILDKYGIGLDSHWNGVFLPRSAHEGLHTAGYYEAITRRLVQGDVSGKRAGVLRALQQIRTDLTGGIFPF
jgi:hypothetical protein